MINIRLGSHHNSPEISQELIDEIKKYPGCCDAVWFSTEYGYPDLKVHRENAQKICQTAKLYRDAGIRVDLQISNTIGHGEYMKAKDCSAKDVYGFEKMVGFDGTEAEYCFCWNGENFRKYTAEMIKCYCAVKPGRVWVDDDLRPTNHFPVNYGCFCDNCISRFNSKFGTHFTREELVKELNSGDIVWRERYTDFICEDLASFAGFITDAVMSVSPESQMGLQYAVIDNYTRGSFRYIFDALRLHSGKPPVCRPGGGVYDDKNPFELLNKQIFMSYANSTLPEYVGYNIPEIENLPDVTLGKSIYGTMLETTLSLAYGFTGVSYAVLMNDYEKTEFFSRMLKDFSDYRGYWEKMIQYSKFTSTAGVGIVKPGRSLKCKKPFDYAAIPTFYGTSLTKIGLAEHHETDSAQVLVLTKEILDTLNNEEIKSLFGRPVITDASVLEQILNRGLLNINVSVEKTENGSLTEIFGDSKWQISFCDSQLDPYIIKGDIKPISFLYRFDRCLGTANAVIDLGTAKWAVFGYALWHHIISSDKRRQVISAADEICEGKLPAILNSAEQVTVIPRINSNLRTACVTLVNISIADTEDLILTIRNPAGTSFIYKNSFFERQITPEIKGEDYILTLPGFKRGWDAATLFISD